MHSDTKICHVIDPNVNSEGSHHINLISTELYAKYNIQPVLKRKIWLSTLWLIFMQKAPIIFNTAR